MSKLGVSKVEITGDIRKAVPQESLSVAPGSSVPGSLLAGSSVAAGLRIAERAICDLRCGAFIVLAGRDAAYLVQAAELLDDDSLVRGSVLSGARPLLVVTGRRAAALGLSAAVPGAARTPTLLSLPETVSAAGLRPLVDPTASLPRRVGLGTVGLGVVADRPDLRIETGRPVAALVSGLQMLRNARLLPALLAWTLPPEAVRTLVRDQGLTLFDAGSGAPAAAPGLTAVAEADVPLLGAEQAHIVAFRPSDGRDEHLAIIVGALDTTTPALIRIHSECFTGDLLGSLRCDCGDQLRGAIAEMGRRGAGILLYLAQEGRGIGLVNKLRAYQLQDAGADTLEANEELGFDADERDFAPAADMLRQLGVGTVRLMTNNPAKVAALEAHGIAVVERVSHAFAANDHNHRYLETKARRAGHLF